MIGWSDRCRAIPMGASGWSPAAIGVGWSCRRRGAARRAG